MKILSFTTICAAAILSLASCNKQSDIKVSDSQTQNNNGNNGNNNSSFNWTGTEPLSLKIDGVGVVATEASPIELGGFYIIRGVLPDGRKLGPLIPVTAKEGLVYSVPTPAGFNYQDGSFQLVGMDGKIKVVTNNATTLEGYFWVDLKSIATQADTVIHLTEGYFKVDKP